MPTIVYMEGKNGQKYAYESTSYWDREKKRPRSRRTYLGKVDENGNILPKKSYNKKGSEIEASEKDDHLVDPVDSVSILERIRELEENLSELNVKVTQYKEENERFMARIRKFQTELASASLSAIQPEQSSQEDQP